MVIEQDEEIMDERFINSLHNFDNLIEDDPYIREIVIRALDSYFDDINYREGLDEYLSVLLGEEISKLIEYSLIFPNESLKLIKENNFIHYTYYFTLINSYKRKMYRNLILKISPIYLENLAIVDTYKEQVYRMIRADNVSFDFYANVPTSIYIIKQLANSLKNDVNLTKVDENFLLESLNEITGTLNSISHFIEAHIFEGEDDV